MLQGVVSCDLNPFNTNWLCSSDAVITSKMLIMKMIFVVVSTLMRELPVVQAGLMAVTMWGVVYYCFEGVSVPCHLSALQLKHTVKGWPCHRLCLHIHP